ncbi:MAG TPA: efflux RND transporter periplasmic adaptor subunit [Anaerolineae bacterium]|nr:efflux RND transporter periplasmic adaptor subunit [Anaerolineae bacterium]
MKKIPTPIRLLPIALVILGASYWYLFVRSQPPTNTLAASGTITTAQIHISPEIGGRVTNIFVTKGDEVTQGTPLLTFDTALLAGQRDQAVARLAAAQANHDMLLAGPTETDLQAVNAAVTRAQTTLDTLTQQKIDAEDKQTELETDIETLNEQIITAQTITTTPPNLAPLTTQLGLLQQTNQLLTTQINSLDAQISIAQAGLDAALATQAQAQAGSRPEQITIAATQVDLAQAALDLLDLQIERQTLLAPADGTILAQAVEIGEFAPPGSNTFVLGQLTDLSITVYVREDQYGAITLGQTATITVDSFPDNTFSGTVRHIADQAEFTPRNVQTAEGRASTVFAIELTITSGHDKLKPGMPADVIFDTD